MNVSPQARSPAVALVLDDDEFVHALLSDMLREANCTPLRARSAEEAEALLEQEPCIAFLDVNLPGKQGDLFCQQLRTSERWWDLPVVMITSEPSGSLHRCFSAGADDFAFKPLSKGQILSKLEAVRRGLLSSHLRKVIGKTVLVATDKGYFGNVFQKLLSNAGYVVHRARSSPEAAKLLQEQQQIDLAVVDLDLGVEVLGGAIAQRESSSAVRLPVVAITSNKARASRPAWAEEALFDVDTELERLVHFVNAALLGTGTGASRERRAKRRVPLKSVVNFRLFGSGTEEWQAGYGYDLSDTGIFVRTLTPLDARLPVELSFKLEESTEPLLARGIVSWTNLPGPRNVFSYPCGMGIAYSYIDAGDWSLLHEWVNARS